MPTETGFDQTSLVPSGGIILWSGSAATVPSGWVICDGTASTPDLMDRFVMGAGPSHAIGSTGGAATHLHNSYSAGSGSTVVSRLSAGDNIPPYYALAYIMKV